MSIWQIRPGHRAKKPDEPAKLTNGSVSIVRAEALRVAGPNHSGNNRAIAPAPVTNAARNPLE
jgi:hypothetical protein